MALTLLGSSIAFASNASVSQGRALVKRNCGSCHAIALTDRSSNVKAPPLRNLHQDYPIEDLGEALAERFGLDIASEHGDVRAFAPREIDDIIQYLNSLQR